MKYVRWWSWEGDVNTYYSIYDLTIVGCTFLAVIYITWHNDDGHTDSKLYA